MDIEGKYTEVMIRWYHLIKDGKPPVIFGDGKQTMDFVYVEDVAKASILALKTPVADQVFNVARGIETSLEELCWLLIEVMGSNVKPKYIPLPDDRKNVEVVRRWADVSNARKLLQFEASVSLKAGLEKLVAWISS
jgi:UDP-glucose 4-epimerase